MVDHLRVTYVPAYLLAAAVGILMLAFVGWGFCLPAGKSPLLYRRYPAPEGQLRRA
jgi:hypothetical protein